MMDYYYLTYYSDKVMIDFVIFFLLFAIILREFFIKTFRKEDYFIAILYLIVSFCFSFSLIVWEIENHLFLSDYWKLFIFLFAVFLFWKIKNYFQHQK